MAQIRPAVPGDALAMARVHVMAVHELASGHYPVDMLHEWSPPDGRLHEQRIRESMDDAANVILVAEEGADLVGFASLFTALWEVRAVYVDPAAARRGVGTALLGGLEAAARARGIAEVELNASLNAEGFYRANGYRVLERRTCQLRGGRRMPCVRMGKLLAPPGA